MIKKFTFNQFLNELVFPPLSLSIICCIAIYILYKNKVNFSEMKNYFITSIMVGVILRTGSYIVILPLLALITILKLKNSKSSNNTIKALLVIFIIHFLSIIYISFLGINFYERDISFKEYFNQFIMASIIVIFTCKVINLFKKVNYKEVSPSQIRYRMILSIIIPIALSIRLIYPFLDERNSKAIYFVIDQYIPEGIPLISIILILIVIYNYDKYIENELRLKIELEEKNRIEEYAAVIENMYNDTRKFKHDYINMLIPLKEYIDQESTDGLKDFFYTNIINMDKDIKWNNSNIDKLKYIKITSLKSILSTKLIKALSMNINVKVDIVEEIRKADINVMDLCRVIGILMDNAIEAAKKCSNPQIYLCVFLKKEYVVITIHNNFSGEKPIIHKIYKEGFSTKGTGRGLGLYTVKSIIDEKYDNVFINTSIENDFFIQELWIKNTK